MAERLQGRSNSLGTLERQPRNFLHSMNAADRERLHPLGTIHLQTSCYNRFSQFRELVAALLEFNDRLEKWHRDELPMDNVLYQHNLFANLSNRLMVDRTADAGSSVSAGRRRSIDGARSHQEVVHCGEAR